jgi:hypothetical protein
MQVLLQIVKWAYKGNKEQRIAVVIWSHWKINILHLNLVELLIFHSVNSQRVILEVEGLSQLSNLMLIRSLLEVITICIDRAQSPKNQVMVVRTSGLSHKAISLPLYCMEILVYLSNNLQTNFIQCQTRKWRYNSRLMTYI